MLERVTTHGAAKGYGRTSVYGIWQGIRGRCRIPTNGGYARYGGRGITFCKRWDDYANFLADMGERPSPKHSVDRIDNNGNYEPSNCRWATNNEQQMNKSTSRNSTTGVTGIRYRVADERWLAHIKVNGTRIFLGSFETKEHAAIARVAAERVLAEIFSQQRLT